jgi:HK97 family phage major capsid protein
MNIDFVSLNEHLREYNELSDLPRHTKEQQRRMAYLQTAIAALKSGASMEQVDEARKSGIAGKYGLTISQPTSREQEARAWREFVEQRGMTEGADTIKSQLGTYSGLGTFVPTNYWSGTMFPALAAADALLDESAVTVLKTTNGRVTTVPTIGDVENVAICIDEAASETSTNISNVNHGILGAYTYRSPRFVASLESFVDADEALGVMGLFNSFTASRLARGIGKHLVNGDGSNKPLGLVPSLEALGVSFVTAAGSASSTGGSETGANSLGIGDFQNALALIDDAYAQSSKFAFFMSRSTLLNVAGIVNKFGDRVNLVEYVGGQPYIMGVRVRICPSMDSIGASNVPVALGAGDYWCTRLVTDGTTGIRQYTEATGLVEYGNVGLSCFVRADGELLYNDTSSPAPFTYIRNHS